MSRRYTLHWRCFHCGAAFTKAQEQQARDHFGVDCMQVPVCLMRVPGEYHILRALRDAQDELQAHRAEDTTLVRALCSQSADHAEALRQEEEKGYARALQDVEDGRLEPAHAVRILHALSVRKTAP